jgi:acyl-coenzyme A thioesterase PaaI-like protein
MTEKEFEEYLTTHIPIAWEAGVRFESYDGNSCSISVELGLMNQNPFRSMFWAVEGMAAEFAGGMMLLSKIEATGVQMSTLVVNGTMTFTKKAVGKIEFTCDQGSKIDQEIEAAIATKEARAFELTSIGIDEEGDQVAEFVFTWSVLCSDNSLN